MRKATFEDMPLLVEMGKRFMGRAEIPVLPEQDAAEETLRGLIERGVIFMTDVGAIGGAIVNPWYSKTWKIAVTWFWWSDDGNGARLLRAFERWGIENGADQITMTGRRDEMAHRVLSRMGYEATETAYGKVV